MFCILFQHNIKKLRNNLFKSVDSGNSKRRLTIHGKLIVWAQLCKVFEWDQQNTLPKYQKLSPGHFNLDSAAMMRNALAEDVLNKDMLLLVQVWDSFLIFIKATNQRHAC